MNSVTYLKKEHEEIFKGLLEIEEIIDNGNNIDYLTLNYVFHKLVDLLLYHRENQKFLFHKINNDDNGIEVPLKEVLINPKLIQGHIIVIGKAINSKNPGNIKVALDNDGRMLIDRVKEHVFKEEKILDRLLFLHSV